MKKVRLILGTKDLYLLRIDTGIGFMTKIIINGVQGIIQLNKSLQFGFFCHQERSTKRHSLRNSKRKLRGE